MVQGPDPALSEAHSVRIVATSCKQEGTAHHKAGLCHVRGACAKPARVFLGVRRVDDTPTHQPNTRGRQRWTSLAVLAIGYGQNLTTRGPQVLVTVSIYQGAILGLPYF